MAHSPHEDVYKEKFRPDDSALESEVEAALAGVSMDELYSFDKPRSAGAAATPGSQARKGKIISIGKDDIFVDFGGKSQGVVPIIQFEDVEPKVGDEFDFIVDRYDEREGVLILNRKGVVSGHVTWENLEVGQIVEGTVTGSNKGGLELEIKTMRAFMPSGQVALYFTPDIESLVGQRMTVEVTQFDRAAKNLIVSRRTILEREKEESKVKLMAELAEGQTRRGTVRNIMDFGAFVDLGGVDGLLHISEMSHRRGRHPSEFVKIGDLVDVKILKIDKETGKLSLSLKSAMADPWANVETRYPVGATITGRVVKLESFGAFVEAEEGLEGLLPISEISWQRIGKVSDVLKEGDIIKVVVLSVDPAARRMSFSLKQAGPDPWSQAKENYAIDSAVTGRVTRVVDFGAFVELEPGLEGLVHISELAGHRVRSANDVVKIGDEVQVRVLEVDKDARRISLSIKRAAEAAAPAAEAAAPAATAKKKKRPELRGGLDWNWK